MAMMQFAELALASLQFLNKASGILPGPKPEEIAFLR